MQSTYRGSWYTKRTGPSTYFNRLACSLLVSTIKFNLSIQCCWDLLSKVYPLTSSRPINNRHTHNKQSCVDLMIFFYKRQYCEIYLSPTASWMIRYCADLNFSEPILHGSKISFHTFALIFARKLCRYTWYQGQNIAIYARQKTQPYFIKYFMHKDSHKAILLYLCASYGLVSISYILRLIQALGISCLAKPYAGMIFDLLIYSQ